MLSAGLCPPIEGSVAAQRKGVDPFRDVGGAPANAPAADVDRMGKAPFAHLSPDGGAAADSGEAQHLLAGDQFSIRHDRFLMVQGSVTGAVFPFRSGGLTVARRAARRSFIQPDTTA